MGLWLIWQLYFSFLKNLILFSIVAAPFISVLRVHTPHILAHTWLFFIIAVLVGMRWWCPIVVLIYVSLVINGLSNSDARAPAVYLSTL